MDQSVKGPWKRCNAYVTAEIVYLHIYKIYFGLRNFKMGPSAINREFGIWSSWIIVFGPCQVLRGEGTISKLIVQFNILDSFLIFVPKTQLSFLKNRQLGSNICPGPNQLSRGPTVWGPICLEPSQLPLSCNVMRKIGKTCPLQSGFGDLFVNLFIPLGMTSVG